MLPSGPQWNERLSFLYSFLKNLCRMVITQYYRHPSILYWDADKQKQGL